MDLEFVVRISARHIPLTTYKKISHVIAWQIENKLSSPFRKPEFRDNLGIGMAPSFSHTNFPSHTSEFENGSDCQFFTNLSRELYREHDFSLGEIRVLDNILGIASIEFNRLADQLSGFSSRFFIYPEVVEIILDSSPNVPDIDGAQVFWGQSDFG
ncbi:hypothetical protein KRX52_03475 [Pseudomonas sp. MAP12]|uniref:Uncharacterized protein n=1 Tax=Geopseudomonas aromaticivorans TaxID=2849492 RepID=A0ABS6MSS2_9GAMM|nr:hypothetical protein [Pseudomonas aromaticivorans]MBV2131855.1 hypothetical protein [Pseudomonas aromaticivorans]